MGRSILGDYLKMKLGLKRKILDLDTQINDIDKHINSSDSKIFINAYKNIKEILYRRRCELTTLIGRNK